MWGPSLELSQVLRGELCRKAGQPIAKLDRKISVTSAVREVRFGRKGFVAGLDSLHHHPYQGSGSYLIAADG